MKLALLAVAWLAGTFLGLRIDAAPLPVILLLLGTVSTGLLLYLGRLSLWPVVLTALLLLALWRVETAQDPGAPLVLQDKQTVTMRGRVTTDPEATPRLTKFVLDVESVDRGQGLEPLGGRILVYAEPPPSLVSMRDPPFFRYGDELLLQGVLERPQAFGGFDYPSFLENQGVSGILWSREVSLVSESPPKFWRSWAFSLRRKLSNQIGEALPEPQAAVGRAMLLGMRGQIPPELVEDFRKTGTSHLLAISGLHVGGLMFVSLGAAGWLLGKRWNLYLLVPLLVIWLYALVSGSPVSVMRAAAMGTVFLAALALGRPRSILPALALAAAVMSGITPRVLDQVSFQLSFAAMAGIALAQPYWTKLIAGDPGVDPSVLRPWLLPVPKAAMTALVISLAATLATWPLVAFYFNRIPLAGIPVTLLALPTLPFILLGTLATAAAGLIHPQLGQLFGWIAWLPLSYLVGLVSQAPGPMVSGSWVAGPLLWAWYVMLMSLLLIPGGRGRARRLLDRLRWPGWRPAVAILATVRPTTAATTFLGLAVLLAAGAVFLWWQVLSGPDGKLHVYFFDVGQGDSALIVTPGGRQVLVDGGPEAGSAIGALAQALPAGDRGLDLVVLTHLDADHSRGLLEVLAKYRLGAVLTGPDGQTSPMYPRWQAALQREKLDVVPVWQPYRIDLEPGISLEVVNPPPEPIGGTWEEENNNSLVLRLVYGRVSFLLAADIEAEAEDYLVGHAPPLASVVLKVPHHGSKTSTTQGFLDHVDPTVAVISSGETNRYGHPHQEVVARLEEAVGVEGLYRTARDGSIEFISDGRNLWVKIHP